MELPGSSDSDETMGSVGSAGSRTDLLGTSRRRYLSAAPSSNNFLSPAFNQAAGTGGSSSSLNTEPSLLHVTQSRMSHLHFSSSTSSNESPENSPTTAAVAARNRLQQLLNLRSLSYSFKRGSTQSPLSPIENLQAPPFSVRSSSPYSFYKSPVEVEDVLVMDALGDPVPLTSRARKSVELLSSSSSSSSINNGHFGPNFFKTEICRSWEECGLCRFGSRCQFAHGKEELRGTPGPSKLKQESGKQLTVGSGGRSSKYPRHAPTSLMDSSSEALPSSSASPEVIIWKINAEKMKSASLVQQRDPTFSWPPTEDEEAEIQWVLYGPGSRRSGRLPVFQDIFLGSEK